MGGYTSNCEKSQNHCTLLYSQCRLPRGCENVRLSSLLLPFQCILKGFLISRVDGVQMSDYQIMKKTVRGTREINESV
jgi:hypothetical protein